MLHSGAKTRPDRRVVLRPPRDDLRDKADREGWEVKKLKQTAICYL
jgi:hypothetical protein